MIGLVEKPNRLLAVPNDMDRDGKLGGGDGFLDQEHIGLVVLHDQDLVMRGLATCVQIGSVKRKVDPRPGSDSTRSAHDIDPQSVGIRPSRFPFRRIRRRYANV